VKVALAVLVIAACYHPVQEETCTVACGTHGECPSGLACNAQQMCSTGGGTCMPPPDSAPDSAPQQVCFTTGKLGMVCVPAPLRPAVPATINTDMMCDLTFTVAGSPLLCAFAVENLNIAGMVQVGGSRPLVLLTNNPVNIGGVLDVTAQPGLSAPGAVPCVGTFDGGTSGSSGGGGAGGSFGTIGGDGGETASMMLGGVAGPVHTPVLRGGCNGGAGGEGVGGMGAGTGGFAGGGVYLYSLAQITIEGQILAFGGGGGGGLVNNGGGGGGGSGGMIVLDGSVMIAAGAILLATGGGGGAGATASAGGAKGSAPDPAQPLTAASGGTAPSGVTGAGGAGAVQMTGSAGLPGSSGGGGGGGGGSGIIRILGPGTISGRIVPPAS
jgi:hypothetical protein